MNSITHLSLKTLNQMVSSKLDHAVLNAMDGLPVLSVSGRLGTIRLSNYQVCFGIELSDTESQESVLIDLPKAIVVAQKLRGGEQVCVTGSLKAHANQFTGHKVQIRLLVSELKVVSTNPEVLEVVPESGRLKATLPRIASLGNKRHFFPKNESVSVGIVFSRSGQSLVNDDFHGQIGPDLHGKFRFVNYQCNMQSPGELANTIERVTEDVIVVIRGGGDQTQFEVFDDMEVVGALARKDSYRIVGLGHTANTTSLDLVADYSANTPTQAGVHLGDCYRRYAYPNETLESENRILQQQLARSQKEVAELLSAQNKGSSKVSKTLELIYAFAIGAIIAGVVVAFKLKK